MLRSAREMSVMVTHEDIRGVVAQETFKPGTDHRVASAQMLALSDAWPAPTTCRHFRNLVPREIADELRDADSEPCRVCDTLPHRRNRVVADYAPI